MPSITGLADRQVRLAEEVAQPADGRRWAARRAPVAARDVWVPHHPEPLRGTRDSCVNSLGAAAARLGRWRRLPSTRASTASGTRARKTSTHSYGLAEHRRRPATFPRTGIRRVGRVGCVLVRCCRTAEPPPFSREVGTGTAGSPRRPGRAGPKEGSLHASACADRCPTTRARTTSSNGDTDRGYPSPAGSSTSPSEYGNP